MKNIFFILSFVIVLLVLPGVLSVPPVTQLTGSDDKELEIIFPKFQYYGDDVLIKLHFHVFNSSGYLMKNDTTSCAFHLYNYTGSHLVKNDSISFDSNQREWQYKVNSDITEQGRDYSYIVWCNNSKQSGWLSTGFEVTNNGYSFQDFSVGAIIGLLGIIALFFAVFVVVKTSLRFVFLLLAFVYNVILSKLMYEYILYYSSTLALSRPLYMVFYISLILMFIMFIYIIVLFWNAIIKIIEGKKKGKFWDNLDNDV